MTITLRYYQEDGLTAIWNYFNNGRKGNPLLAWPTGTGKSVVPAVFIERIMKIWPNQRFMMITHVKELIEQNAEVLKIAWPDAPLGIYSAGLKSKHTAHPIIFAGIQSAIKNPAIFGHRDIIFIDEAHLISQDESSQYITFLTTMKMINPFLKVIGLTATPYRMGQGLLIDEGLIFTDIIQDLTSMDEFNRLIAQGYLAPLIPLRTKTELDVSNVGMSKGDYIAGQLQHAVDRNEVTYGALRELVEAGANRRSWLIFSSGIEHAEHIASMLGTWGINCAAVHSKQDAEYNNKAIKAFKSNQLRAIANFSKLTTGFNHPYIDCIADLRPTMSIPLHVQKLGRGTRPADGKDNCIAEGTLILTDQGLIPIENISLTMKLWDGIEFVSHDGIVCNGLQNVIEYAGLIATPNHLVWTKNGWKTFEQSFSEQTSICITGNGRTPIRQIESYFTRNNLSWKKKQTSSIYFNRMSSLFNSKFKSILQSNIFKSWMPNLWQQSCMATATKMVTVALYSSKRSLYKQKQSKVSRLWRSWNTIQIFNFNSNGYMDYAKSWITQKITNRSYLQRSTLRNWQLKIFNSYRKYEQQKKIQFQGNNNLSTRIVFDILNSGPRNQFTANGLLVHNCLVLDYSRNVPRLGPINDPAIPKKKGVGTGDIPVKLCESCGAYNHISARKCCQCGAEFTFQVKIVKNAGSAEILRSDAPIVEMFDVTSVIYAKKISKNTNIPYIRTTYFCGMQMFNENVFPEHSGYAKTLFRNWWRQRHITEPPATVNEALSYINQLRKPRRIRVWCNRKYPEIMAAEY